MPLSSQEMVALASTAITANSAANVAATTAAPAPTQDASQQRNQRNKLKRKRKDSDEKENIEEFVRPHGLSDRKFYEWKSPVDNKSGKIMFTKMAFNGPVDRRSQKRKLEDALEKSESEKAELKDENERLTVMLDLFAVSHQQSIDNGEEYRVLFEYYKFQYEQTEEGKASSAVSSTDSSPKSYFYL